MGKYIDAGGLSHFMGIIKGALNGKSDTSHNHDSVYLKDVNYDSTNKKLTKTKGSTTSDIVTAATLKTDMALNNVDNTSDANKPISTATQTALDGKAASSHAHGNITNGGDITATAPTIASGDKLIINDESASKITNGPSFGTSTTTFLRNDGSWGTPVGTTYSDFTGATSSAAGTHGLVPAPASGDTKSILSSDGDWKGVAEAIAYADVNNLANGAGFVRINEPQSTSSGTQIDLELFSTIPVENGGTGKTSVTSGSLLKGNGTSAMTELAASGFASWLGNNAVNRATGDGSGNNIANTYAPKASPALTGTPTAPTATAGTNTTQIATTAFVKTAVDTAFGDVAGALVYKGTLGTGGTATSLPANHSKGWYYIVKTAGTYAGKVCEAGDMVICNATGTASTDSHWDVIQTNIETLSNDEIDALWAAA